MTLSTTDLELARPKATTTEASFTLSSSRGLEKETHSQGLTALLAAWDVLAVTLAYMGQQTT